MWSTPLIWLSIGVATDCSRVVASAPGYVAWTRISGGTMSGNWAVGRLNIATPPTMTIKIEITIETIGRSINSFEIIASSLLALLRRSGSQESHRALSYLRRRQQTHLDSSRSRSPTLDRRAVLP